MALVVFPTSDMSMDAPPEDVAPTCGYPCFWVIEVL